MMATPTTGILKPMLITKRRATRRARPIEVQISARVALPRGWAFPRETVIREAIIRKANDPDHDDPSGITLRITAWRHGTGARWRNAPHDEAHLWADFARFLPQASIVIHTARKVRGR